MLLPCSRASLLLAWSKYLTAHQCFSCKDNNEAAHLCPFSSLPRAVPLIFIIWIVANGTKTFHSQFFLQTSSWHFLKPTGLWKIKIHPNYSQWIEVGIFLSSPPTWYNWWKGWHWFTTSTWRTGHAGCRDLPVLLDVLQIPVRCRGLGHGCCCSRRVSSDTACSL